jgi:acyl-CoA thioester hydrolase
MRIRWRDLDPYGHVNHAVYVTYLEELRDDWLTEALGLDGVWDYVVARLAIDYRRELRPADGPLRAELVVERVGRTSVATRERLLTAAGEEAAAAEAVLVAVDRATGRPRPLTQGEREPLERQLAP